MKQQNGSPVPAGKNNHLIILLGKTQTELKKTHDEYQVAKYSIAGGQGEIFETPFVGEAILRLSRKKFTHLHIFGTAESIWQTLILHFSKNQPHSGETDEYFYSVVDKKETKNLKEEDLLPLAEIVKIRFDLKFAECRIIPKGVNDNEVWGIFDKITAVNINRGDIVSIDITHGLRFQPVMLMLFLFFMKINKPDVAVDSIFYGALELKKEPGNNDIAPIYDLKVFAELIDWITAAEVFSKYGDSKKIAELLAKNSVPDSLLRRFTKYNSVVNLNALRDIKTDAKGFLETVNSAPFQAIPPFRLITSALRELPEKMCREDMPKPKAIFLIAKRNLENGQLALSLLNLWEAVIEYFGELYALDPNQKNQYELLITRIKKENCKKDPIFRDNFNKLRNFRNGTAHSELLEFISSANVLKTIPDLFKFFEQKLFTELK